MLQACVYAFRDSKYIEDKVIMGINSLMGTFPLLSQLYRECQNETSISDN